LARKRATNEATVIPATPTFWERAPASSSWTSAPIGLPSLSQKPQACSLIRQDCKFSQPYKAPSPPVAVTTQPLHQPCRVELILQREPITLHGSPFSVFQRVVSAWVSATSHELQIKIPSAPLWPAPATLFSSGLLKPHLTLSIIQDYLYTIHKHIFDLIRIWILIYI